MTPVAEPLPLFPLQAVLFPGGALSLKVFEARYLDLAGRCLREALPFGVVCLTAGHEVRVPGDTTPPRFEPLGTLAEVVEADAERAGLMRLRCRGTRRFRYARTHQQADGLWLAEGVECLPDEPALPPGPVLQPSADALGRALAVIAARDPQHLVGEPRLDDAGWVANRWCELLPISLQARQRLLALDDPMSRLQVVHAFLAQQGLLQPPGTPG